MGQGPQPDSVVERLRQLFPDIVASCFRVTSPMTVEYNCVAWAVHDNRRWWDTAPGYFWPHDVQNDWTLATFVRAFEEVGFAECSQGEFESGFERIAILVDDDGDFAHVARQLGLGKWTSKLGDWEDIEHDLSLLQNSTYGRLVSFMRRRLEPASG